MQNSVKISCDESQNEIHAGVSLTAAQARQQINDVNDIFNRLLVVFGGKRELTEMAQGTQESVN